MEKRRMLRVSICFIGLLVLAGLFFCLSLMSGSTHISPASVFGILTGRPADAASVRILTDIRLPRTLSALILGGGLSVSGFLLQSFFRNPIAGPFVLGISSGAKLTVALLMIAALQHGFVMHSSMMIAAAFVGAVLCMLMVLLFSGKVRSMAQLVISGVMIGYICNALTDLAVTFADDANIVNLHNWSKGSFSGADWQDIRAMTLLVFAALIGAFLLSKPIGAYQLGEAYAENMGVNIRRFRLLLILLSSLLSACVTAFAGPVSFVGIAVPHLMKGMFGTAKPLILIPAAFLGGGVFCMGCDLIARTLFAPQELSVSTVTAVFGAPVVIYIMLHRAKERSTS
ncbi:MAG: iron ABC transporter permease [Oscillospiraceae bacterium]|nr:iron ABC transporter permease [Oscillospiraceae bacterium]